MHFLKNGNVNTHKHKPFFNTSTWTNTEMELIRSIQDTRVYRLILAISAYFEKSLFRTSNNLYKIKELFSVENFGAYNISYCTTFVTTCQWWVVSSRSVDPLFFLYHSQLTTPRSKLCNKWWSYHFPYCESFYGTLVFYLEWYLG